MTLIIILSVWLVGALLSYPIIKRNADADASRYEVVWFTLLWPIYYILWIIFRMEKKHW